MDAKNFGTLKDDPVDADGTAALMEYAEQDTDPSFFSEMNTKCYDRDRFHSQPRKTSHYPCHSYYVPLTRKKVQDN